MIYGALFTHNEQLQTVAPFRVETARPRAGAHIFGCSILSRLSSTVTITSAMGKCCSGEDLMLSILAFFLSPLAMAIRFGCEERTFINILLFILGVLPGMFHECDLFCVAPTAARCPFLASALSLTIFTGRIHFSNSV
jgi:uncharacterized membrane protein YqaE (UPF0057 family)